MTADLNFLKELQQVAAAAAATTVTITYRITQYSLHTSSSCYNTAKRNLPDIYTLPEGKANPNVLC